jgi:hypothetical protein
LNLDVTVCPECARRTAAARGTCIYCGAQLPISEIAVAPAQQSIESFEFAFNTVLQPARSRTDERVETALATALKIEPQEARALIDSGKPVPVARSKNRTEAEMIAMLVRGCGLASEVVADQQLGLQTEIVRARKIARLGTELELHHSGGTLTIAFSDIKLFVIGALRNTRVDYTEGRAGKPGQAASVLDTSEYRSEEMLLDVYTETLDRSFRIKSDAFDYSGLVWPLAFRAEMNFQTAIAALHGSAPTAKVDDDFARVRGLFARAWPERSRTESRGVRRTGLAYRPVAQSSIVSDNRDQFDRYSRLMFYYLKTSNV